MKQFDKHADAYETIRAKISYPEKLYNMLANQSPARDAALDIGCGNGVSTFRLREYFKFVEGQDLGEKLIDHAKKSYPEVSFSVSTGENLKSDRKFNLVTSATSFYWMNRDAVLPLIANVLTANGIFCAYKYDFPVVYGPIRKIIENDLAMCWSRNRDDRLIDFDDTLQKIENSGSFCDAERFILSNIIELTPQQVALFFLSTSYVTRFIDAEGGPEYANDFIQKVCSATTQDKVYVNFDIHGFKARKK